MILAIESSCDDSALALFCQRRGFLGEWVYRQTALHQVYGGVVPDLACREHMAWLPKLLMQSLPVIEAQRPDTIAVTMGPGLAGSLGVGIACAQALGLAWGIPIVEVNHLHGHAFSPFINLFEQGLRETSDFSIEAFKARLASYLPHLGLLVSGSNTLLFSLESNLKFTILAQTVDDAAGEALDKGAKILGMPYPGGPWIEAQARSGNSKAYDFPRAFPQRDMLKFSFSGLKTSLRYCVEKLDDAALAQAMPDLCASYQEAVVAALVRKTQQVLEANPGQYKSLGLSGGVANNTELRQRLTRLAEKVALPLFLAQARYTGDNASMIAFAAWLSEAEPLFTPMLSFKPALPLAGL